MNNTEGFSTYFQMMGPSVLQDYRWLSFSFRNDVSYQDFAHAYVQTSCAQCSIHDVPSILFSLARAIGYAVHSLFSYFSEYDFWLHLYQSARKFQEAWGRTVRLLCNESYGSYLVQKALFHMAYYAIQPVADAHYTTIPEFQKMGQSKQKKLLTLLGIPEFQELFNRIELDERNYFCIGEPRENSLPFKCWALSLEELVALPLQEFLTCTERLPGSSLKERLEKARKEGILEAPALFDPETASIGQFYAANGAILAPHMKGITPAICSLLRTKQIIELDFTTLSQDQLNSFCYSKCRKPKKFLSKLSIENLQILLEKSTFDDIYFFDQIPIERIPFLDFALFADPIIRRVLDRNPTRFHAVSTPINLWARSLHFRDAERLSIKQLNDLDPTLAPDLDWETSILENPESDSLITKYNNFMEHTNG